MKRIPAAMAALALGLTAGGCALPMPKPVPSDLPADPGPSEPDPAAIETVVGYPNMRAAIVAPSRATYDPRAIGLAGKWVAIRLSNTGTAPLAVDHFRASFSASRAGVAFPCDPQRSATARPREPSTLQPGQSFDFERDLDCTMPLPGRYEVSVFVDVGPNDPSAAAPARAHPAGKFSLDLVANGTNAPQPYPSRDGLFVLMTGAHATRPLSAEAWARGDYQVVLAFINGSAKPVSVGPGKVAFSVYKLGTPLPCSGQANEVAGPDSLPPGSVRIVRAPVACAPSEEGNYAIVGRLTLLQVGQEVDVGRIPLRVSGDPRVLAPVPWGPLNMWPTTPSPR